jgi:1-pyrroline dehydrogenase
MTLLTDPTDVAGPGRAASAESRRGETIDVIDPSTGGLIAAVPSTTPEQLDRVVERARAGFGTWSQLTPNERDEALNALADAIDSHADELAEIEAMNTGRPLAQAKDEVATTARQFRFYGGAARVMQGTAAAEYLPGRTSFVRRDPLGVIGQITPWNYPLVMAAWKLGPALAAGNAVVIKPSELTPLSTLKLVELAEHILPEGAVNVVTGDGRIGAAIAAHPGIDMVCVTGSVETGRKVIEAASASVKRTHVELGGNAPVLVFEDADPLAVAARLRVGSFWNAGQDCTAATRILVHESLHDALVDALVAEARALAVAGPFERGGSDMGPLISGRHTERVLGFIERARAAGASVVEGGERLDRPGNFVQPTVITGVAQDDEIVQGEVFGPVVTVQPFRDEGEAVALANGTDYGLSASVWTRDVGRALRLTREIDAGAVWVNDHLTVVDEMPHGGMKLSGYGKDLGAYAIEDYTVVRHIMIRTDEPGRTA